MSEYYAELANKSKRNYDRYKNCKLLEDKETGELLLSSLNPIEIHHHPNDIYHRIKNNEVSRLDILAHLYYKNPLLWWVIALANDIHDPFLPLDPGTLIRIPAIETLYGKDGILL